MALCTKHCTKKAPLLVHLWVHHSRLLFLLHIEAAGWQRLLTLDWLQCLSSVTIAAAHILKIAALIRMRRDFSGFANWWQQVTEEEEEWLTANDIRSSYKRANCRTSPVSDWLSSVAWHEFGVILVLVSCQEEQRHNSLSTCWTCECSQNDLNTSQIQLKLYNRKEKPLWLKYSKSSL